MTTAARGHPIREVVIKIHERCDLACNHCYMYEAVDQGWRDRPIVMSAATVEQTASRLAEHATMHDLSDVRVVLHGGEPLLAGVARLEHALVAFQSAVGPYTKVFFAIQTNAIRLDGEFLELFGRHRVRVGVSLDGGRSANDRHRVYASGRSSYDAAVTGINLLREFHNPHVYGGLLCTADVDNDPIEVYHSLLRHGPPLIDFLLPHGNWAFPPPRLDASESRHAGGSDHPYADWLIAIFDEWYTAPRQETRIRLFESIVSLLLGGASDTEAVGPGVPAAITVESDGSIEGSDGMKTTRPAGGATGFNVFDNSFDEVVNHPMIAAARLGRDGLGPDCQRCPVVGVCGGGLHAHRFSPDHGFARPSIYCADLFRLIGHIRARVEADLAHRGGDLAGAST